MKVVNRRCAGLDEHKDEMACVRRAGRGKSGHEVRRFSTVTRGLLELADWLGEPGVTQVGHGGDWVYWKPVWHVPEGHVELVLASAAHIRNVPGARATSTTRPGSPT